MPAFDCARNAVHPLKPKKSAAFFDEGLEEELSTGTWDNAYALAAANQRKKLLRYFAKKRSGIRDPNIGGAFNRVCQVARCLDGARFFDGIAVTVDDLYGFRPFLGIRGIDNDLMTLRGEFGGHKRANVSAAN